MPFDAARDNQSPLRTSRHAHRACLWVDAADGRFGQLVKNSARDAAEIIESMATTRSGERRYWPEDAALSYTSTPKTTPNPLKTG